LPDPGSRPPGPAPEDEALPPRRTVRPAADPTEELGSEERGLPRQGLAAIEGYIRRSALLAMILLALVAGLPGLVGGETEEPWSLWTATGSTNAVALPFLGLLALVYFPPIRPGRRAALGALVGTALLGFAALVLGSVVRNGAFKAQPAMTELFQRSPGAGWLVLFAAVCLPATLVWRSRDPRRLGARLVVVIGFASAAFAYAGLHLVGGGDDLPARALVTATWSSAYLGDRVAAALALPPAMLAIVALVASLTQRSDRWLRRLALLWCLAASLPPLALAAFVVPAALWREALEPVKASLLLAAALVMAPPAIGYWFAQVAARRAVTPVPSGRAD
jgi:hypothetical protein